MSRFRLVRSCAAFFAGAIAFVLVACGEPPPPQQPQQQPQTQQQGQGQQGQSAGFVDRLCNTLCKKNVECIPGWDPAQCQQNCRERGSPARAFWREDYAKATLACLDAAGCDVMSKGDTIEKTCFGDTRPAPSETAKKLCDVSLDKERTCSDAAAPDSAACLKKWGMIDDAKLKEMLACQERPCGEAARCAKAAVGIKEP
jgi:hypothetical protein